jgi:hypothetical protein
MSDLIGVVSLLKTISPNVYTGEIPETQTEPSMLVTNVANLFGRVLSGKKVQKSSVWRITIVAELQSDVELIMSKLEDLDASTTLDFQQIFTSLVLTELGLIEQPFRRAFYDLTVYKR